MLGWLVSFEHPNDDARPASSVVLEIRHDAPSVAARGPP